MQVQSGTLVGQRFRLLARMHGDDVGRWWRAADRIPGKHVAIRIVDTELALAAAETFERDLALAKGVRHRAFARVHAVGRECDEVLWAAHELVEGEPLDAILEHGPLTASDALALVADVAAALAELHALGVAHGSVGARSIVVQGLRPKLTNLGLARLLGARQMSARAHRMPDAPYFAPEVIASQPFEPAADVWALGAVLYRCVRGAPPLSARTFVSLQPELRRIDAIVSSIEDARARELVAACLAIDPHARPRAADVAARARLAARELWQELRIEPTSTPAIEIPTVAPEVFHSVASEVSAPPVVAPTPVPESVTPILTHEEVELAPDFARRRSRAPMVGAAIAAAAIAIGLFITTRKSERPRRPAPVVAPAAASPTVTVEASAVAPPSHPAAPSVVPSSSATASPSEKPIVPVVRAEKKKVSDDNPYE